MQYRDANKKKPALREQLVDGPELGERSPEAVGRVDAAKAPIPATNAIETIQPSFQNFSLKDPDSAAFSENFSIKNQLTKERFLVSTE